MGTRWVIHSSTITAGNYVYLLFIICLWFLLLYLNHIGLYIGLPNYHKHKPDMEVHAYNLGTWEVTAGRSIAKGHPWLHSKVETSLASVKTLSTLPQNILTIILLSMVKKY